VSKVSIKFQVIIIFKWIKVGRSPVVHIRDGHEIQRSELSKFPDNYFFAMSTNSDNSSNTLNYK
jgi:hypothetical protein